MNNLVILGWAEQVRRGRVVCVLRSFTIAGLMAGFGVTGMLQGADASSADGTPVLRQYCYGCHGKAAAGGINLQQLTSQGSIGDSFHHWEKVAAAIEEKRMPPAQMKQPGDEERKAAVTWIRAKLDEYAEKHAGDPGPVTVRRLTSGEYSYAIRDLTGLDLHFDRDFVSDSAGGEGFTNFGDVQFMEDASLERYLEAAKKIADHAVIGSGPIGFFEDPGKSGFELSAIKRIYDIYHEHGFRNIAGEGAQPYNLEKYGEVFFVCWEYLHRGTLGHGSGTLEELAAKRGVSPRFARHVWSVLHQENPTYPTSDVAGRWRQLPTPVRGFTEQASVTARASSEELQNFVIDWARWLFAAGPMESTVGDDEIFFLTDESLAVHKKKNIRFLAGRLRPGQDEAEGEKRQAGPRVVRVYLSVTQMNPNASTQPAVVWRKAAYRNFQRGANRRDGSRGEPLNTILDEESLRNLRFGQGLDGAAIGADEFVIPAGGMRFFDVAVPEDASGMALSFETEILGAGSTDAILRCAISNHPEVSQGRTNAVLLGDSGSEGYQAWKAGLLEFASLLPQNSHGEGAPSDRDPIPLPFDNAYNKPERDHFHIKLKYYRDDRFLYEKILDDETRERLDQGWNDLLASFEYHDIFLQFVNEKYNLNLKKTKIAKLEEAEMEALPAEPRMYVKALRAEYDAVHKAQRDARPRHVEDALAFASKAWRRPLTEPEKESLRSFYTQLRSGPELDHGKAIEMVLARVLVAPAFLYRLERQAEEADARLLTDWELANRLSFFLWSSLPDDELRRAAAAGELRDPEQLQGQAKRMLADPKARRLATEFFGQWLGFYRFDQYRGVDTSRFPEFTDEVKSGMYNEAVSFFEHIIRQDRPVREMLFANYTFLNEPLAKFYGVEGVMSKSDSELVENANSFQRGGLLRLGAVHTVTSAPLRTSPVKRGDWMLRRILGTPTPPPPPDAGSLPADPKSFGGMTLFEKLQAHQSNPSCVGCHSRIDPMGFPLERYDAIGRWRESYEDGKPVHDAATLADNTPIAGVDGLLKYLKVQEHQVLRTLATKLLGFALGRTVLGSDKLLIDDMIQSGGDATFSKLAADIVASRQFRYRREREDEQPASDTRPEVTPVAASPPQTDPGAGRPAKRSNQEGGL